jgi:iodotyrosine deiodinase
MSESNPAYRPVPFHPPRRSAAEGLAILEAAGIEAIARRSVRHFSPDPVPRALIERAIVIAGTAPSGAHRQPWQFVAISDPALKARIRQVAEIEEREFYERRAPAEWREALAPLGTDFHKDYLEIAPWLIIVFRRDPDVLPDGRRLKNYYVQESVGIAVGFLIQALHRAGLATLTHTPSPMGFLRELCDRPANEKPFVLMPVGYPAEDCTVPDLVRKPLTEIATFLGSPGART